jgi:hypothetical protein
MRLNLSRFAIPAVTAVMLAAGPVTSFAQETGLAGSPYTATTVLADALFGNLPIVRDLTENYIANVVASLGTVELAELNERCAVITDRPFYYGLLNAEFCERVLVEQGLIAEDDSSSDATEVHNLVGSSSDSASSSASSSSSSSGDSSSSSSSSGDSSSSA